MWLNITLLGIVSTEIYKCVVYNTLILPINKGNMAIIYQIKLQEGLRYPLPSKISNDYILKVVKVDDGLCPSYYKQVLCFTAGALTAKLELYEKDRLLGAVVIGTREGDKDISEWKAFIKPGTTIQERFKYHSWISPSQTKGDLELSFQYEEVA